MTQVVNFLAFAYELADAAGEVTLSYFRQLLPVEKKSTTVL